MKHAILLLSSYGADYLNNNIEQFNNDPDIDIYIHIDGTTYKEKDKIIIKDNIKYCDHLYKSARFSFELVEVMYQLLKISYKNNYDYYHFFSDHCYIHTTLDTFKKFFENNTYSYMSYWKHEFWIRPYKFEEILLKYKGSQWNSFHNDIVTKIIENENIIEKYKNRFNNDKIQIVDAACDEMIFQNIIIIDIFHENTNEINKYIKNKNLREIQWKYGRGDYYKKSKLNEYNIKHIRENSLIIRKIDYKNNDSWRFLLMLKNIDKIKYNKHITIWCNNSLPKNELKKIYNITNTDILKLHNVYEKHPGINIDLSNVQLCEFCAIYYIWANNIKSDIVGFCGYRRHFNKNTIDIERINNGEVQTWECPRNFYHPHDLRNNNFLEWCFNFTYSDYPIYLFCETLGKYVNKDVLSIINDLSNINIINKYPGRCMFICKWEIFDRIMTIYNDFLNKCIPNFINTDNVKKYLNIHNFLFLQKYNIGDLDLHRSDQNFYWEGEDNNPIFNDRSFSYYNESLLGVLIEYLYPTFENVLNYYIDIDNLDNYDILFDFYLKNLKNGVRGFHIYSNNDNNIDLGNYDKRKYEKMIVIPKCWADDYKYWKRTITDKNYFEENKFFVWNKKENKFVEE